MEWVEENDNGFDNEKDEATALRRKRKLELTRRIAEARYTV